MHILLLDDLGKCRGVLGVSCQKTKYQLGADTMRISQVSRNLRYHINSNQNLMDFWPDIPVKRNDRYRRTSCPNMHKCGTFKNLQHSNGNVHLTEFFLKCQNGRKLKTQKCKIGIGKSFFDFSGPTLIHSIGIEFFVPNLLTVTERRPVMKVSQAVANFLNYQKMNAKKKHCQELSAFPEQI